MVAQMLMLGVGWVSRKDARQSTLVGATIGTFIAPGVGTVIGGGVGAVIGTVAYTFTDWLPGVEKSIGTSINNAVTNTSRTVIGWFQ